MTQHRATAPTRVAVVTDSTARIDARTARRRNIAIVPLQVIVDDETYFDSVTIDSGVVAAKLRARQRVTTSRPAPGAFAQVYEQLGEDGFDAIVSVHISNDLSGTCMSAQIAADMVDIPVTVIDSRTLSVELGHCATRAAKAAAQGASMDEVAHAARVARDGAATRFCVDSLEYLWRGGRIRAAEAVVGTALNMKPLLHIFDGQVQPLERPRAGFPLLSTTKALARLADLAARDFSEHRAAGLTPSLVVQHVDAPSTAQRLVTQLENVVPDIGELDVVDAGAVIAAHVGPGSVGVTVVVHR